MDEDRVEGKMKETEGEAQQAWGKTKDKVRDVADDLKDRFSDEDDEDAPTANS